MNGSTDVLRRCPVCAQDAGEAWLRKGDLRMVRCRHCSMLYLNPVPSPYASGQFYNDAAEYYLSPEKLQSDYADVRFQRELRLFRRHCRAGDILDVGCSSGGFLFQLNHRFPGCYRILGTDVSGPPLDYAESRGVPVVRGSFPDLNLPEQSFDAVTFWAVLEHLIEPAIFLQKTWSLLRPGGLCFVLVPNMDSLAARFLGERYRYFYPQHLNYFTRSTLARLCQPHFSTLQVFCTHFNPVVIWQDWRRAGQDVSNRERANLLQRTTAWKQNPALKPVRVLYQWAEQALASLYLADNLTVVLQRKEQPQSASPS